MSGSKHSWVQAGWYRGVPDSDVRRFVPPRGQFDRWLVDPAVHYADRELELAYLHMSGDVPPALLAAYTDDWPLDPGYEQRRPALQLHKLLIHVRHFGAKYLDEVASVLDHYGW
jgi:fructosamine-3-kinase